MIEFKMGRKFTDDDFTPYIGKLGNEALTPLPNGTKIDPLEFLNTLACGGHMLQPKWGYARVGDSNQWTQFFLRPGEGSGYAVTYGGDRYVDGKRYSTPIVQFFALCNHEVEDHPGANHSRGWHPGHCRLCGMDTTYDSGD